MHYQNFNVLPRTIPYIFTHFSMVLGLFATRYHDLVHFFKKSIDMHFFYKLHGNTLQISPKPG